MVSFNLVLPQIFGETLLFDKHSEFVVLYYLFWITVALYLFPFGRVSAHTVSRHALVAGLAIITFSGAMYTYLYSFLLGSIDINSYFGASPEGIFVPTFAFWISKISEIIFQQVLIFALVHSLYRHLHSVTSVTVWYCFLFTTAHLFLVYTLGISITALFMWTSALAACIFPYLILRVPGGPVYTCALHVLFYVILSGALIGILFASA